MIKVNLLPPEYRVKERTPLPMMLGILGGVALTSLAVVGFLFVRLGKLPEADRNLKNKQETLNFYRQKAAKHAELKAEKANLDKLDQAVKKLEEQGYPWTKSLDDLAWLVTRAEKSKRTIHSWYENLEFKFEAVRTRGAKGPPTPTLTFDLYVAGREHDQVGLFREMLRQSEGWLGTNIKALGLPSIKEKDYRDYVPNVALESPIEIELLPQPVIAAPAGETPPTGENPPGGAKNN